MVAVLLLMVKKENEEPPLKPPPPPPRDGILPRWGDCKGIARQTVGPSFDATKRNTSDVCFALMPCQREGMLLGVQRNNKEFLDTRTTPLKCCTSSVCITGIGRVARAVEEEALEHGVGLAGGLAPACATHPACLEGGFALALGKARMLFFTSTQNFLIRNSLRSMPDPSDH